MCSNFTPAGPSMACGLWPFQEKAKVFPEGVSSHPARSRHLAGQRDGRQLRWQSRTDDATHKRTQARRDAGPRNTAPFRRKPRFFLKGCPGILLGRVTTQANVMDANSGGRVEPTMPSVSERRPEGMRERETQPQYLAQGSHKLPTGRGALTCTGRSVSGQRKPMALACKPIGLLRSGSCGPSPP